MAIYCHVLLDMAILCHIYNHIWPYYGHTGPYIAKYDNDIYHTGMAGPGHGEVLFGGSDPPTVLQRSKKNYGTILLILRFLTDNSFLTFAYF